MDMAERKIPEEGAQVPQSRAKVTTHPSARNSTQHREHSRRHRSSQRTKHMRALRIINLLLIITLVVVFIGWINTWVNQSKAEREQFELAMSLRQHTQELENLRARNVELEANLAALVEKRLPGLQTLRFDATLPIDERYVRNINFTRTGIGSQIHYEYSIVLENRTKDILTPEVRILLFDESGIQAGSIKLSKQAATNYSDLKFLDPREIRAYKGVIPVNRNNIPKYFQIYMD